ncbi:hypothetical protein ACFL2G_03680 [Candidatus Omnitrophota bacterium]
MTKLLFVVLSCVFVIGGVSISYAQEEKLLTLFEAKEFEKSTVAVKAYLTDNIFEATITARMYQTKPKIHNAIVVGPKLGRLSIESKEVLLATTMEEEPYPTKRKDKGFIHFGKDKKNKKATGTLTRELLVFKIPEDKVKKDKKYKLWIQTESLQRGGKYKTFKFDLENFFERLKESAATSALKNISNACERFRSEQTPLTYPADLSELTPYIDTDLAESTTPERAREHYYYTYLKINDDEFTCTATPAEDDNEVMRVFFLDESGVIKLNDTDGLPLSKIMLP